MGRGEKPIRNRVRRTLSKCLNETGPSTRFWIVPWIAFYNSTRPHQALGYRVPMAVWRDGVVGANLDTAVDMTLRLNTAGALSTCPQPQQQRKFVAQ